MIRRALVVAGLLLAVTGTAHADPITVSTTPAATPGIVLASEGPADTTPHEVLAIKPCGDVVYVGGHFHRLTNGLTRTNLFAYSRTTGQVLPWAPVIPWDNTTTVETIDTGATCGTVYVGGTFATIGGVIRNGLAAVSSTGAVSTTFVPNPVGPGAVRPTVRHVKYIGGRLYAAGNFVGIGGSTQAAIASLDPTTGRDTGYIRNRVAGVRPTPGAGPTAVMDFDVTLTAVPDRTIGGAPAAHLVAVGNFATVDGYTRGQAFMLTLTSPTTRLTYWDNAQLSFDGYGPFGNWAADVTFAPSGRWFCMASTGGAFRPPYLEDSVSRWDLSQVVGTLINPVWVNYTGGDSLYSCAPSESVIYVGGHQRWLDNTPTGTRGQPGSCGWDSQCPGSAARAGIGAVDATTGKALAWNPDRSRAHGAQELVLDAGGLFIGSDGPELAHLPRPGLGYLPYP